MTRNLIAAAVIAALSPAIAAGQDYPAKSIRIITAPVGGGADFIARLLAQGLTTSLGRAVIVDNRPTSVIADTVARAPPDGYTLLVAGPNFWTGPLFAKVEYDPVKDFAAITWAVMSPNIVVVHPSLPVKSIKELIALAKARPGEINYAFGTIGSSSHLSAELFKSMARINMVGIPYKGAGPATSAVVAGEVQLTIGSVTSTEPQVKSGRLRALAVTSRAPSALAPGLPTVAASGLPGYEATTTNGVYAPAQTPAAIVNRLNQEIVRFLNTEDSKQKLQNAGQEVVANSPQEAAAGVKSETATLAKLMKTLGVRAH